MQNAVNGIKRLIEDAIRQGGVTGKNNLIRSQQPVNLLHDAVKSAFIAQGVNTNLICPKLGTHRGELKLAGRLKFKDQDICLLPNNIQQQVETIAFDGLLNGEQDSYGKDYTEHILSVNVRSQLSSIEKNFDTLYERTFAETVNLHLRCPNMVLGEFYMIPVKPYNDEDAKNNSVSFLNAIDLEKYIKAFSALNNRNMANGEGHKYERICLLIVDFDNPVPVIYNTTQELMDARLLPAASMADIDQMNLPTFVDSLLNIYQQRFGVGRFT